MENKKGPERIGFTWQRILQAASILMAILFFCPAFRISLLGFKLNLSGANVMFGKTITLLGMSSRTKGNILGIVLLLLPIAIFCIWQFYLKIGMHLAALLSAAAAGVNFLVWIGFRIYWGSQAKSDYGEFGSTLVFWLTLLLTLAVAAVSVLIGIGRLETEQALSDATVDVTKLKGTASGIAGAAANAAGKAVNSVSRGTGAVPKMSQCPNCGRQLTPADRFCPKCGAKCGEPEQTPEIVKEAMQETAAADTEKKER